MSALEKLREVDLYALMQTSQVKKGFQFYNLILEPTRTGETLTGIVLDRQRCTVSVTVAPGAITGDCTCFGASHPCKHMAALLIKWIHARDTFTQGGAPVAMMRAGASGLQVVPVAPPVTQRPKELPGWLRKSWAEQQQLAQKQLTDWLNNLRLEELRALARKHDWVVKGTRKADVIDQLLTYLAQPEQVLRILAQLDQEHRQALRAVALLGNFMTMRLNQMEQVAKFWGQLKRHSNFSTYVCHLTETGLALSQEQMGQYTYGMPAATIPALITRLLPPLLAEALPTQRDLAAVVHANNGATADGLQIADPDWLVRTVTQLLVILEQTTPALRPPMPRPYHEKAYPALPGWDYVADEVYQIEQNAKGRQHHQAVTLTVPPPSHPLTDATLAELTPLAGDADRLEFLYQLMVSIGLLQPGSPVTVWPEVKEQFLRQSMPVQQAILLRGYFGMENWSELWPLLRREADLHLVRTTFLHHNNTHHPQLLAQELAACRTLVLTACAWLPDDQWVKLIDLLNLLRTVWPKFNQNFWADNYFGYTRENDRGAWHLTAGQQPLDGKDAQEWQLAQGNFVRTLLSGPLHWLGLVDLYHEGGTLTAVRFHGLGDLFLERTETVTLRVPAGAASGGQALPTNAKELVTIDGDQVAVAPSLITAQAHSLLDRIATLALAKPHQFLYRLDAATVQRSFEAGATLAELVSAWETTLSKPIPPPVRKRLTGWWNAYGQLRLYQDVTLIEFGDDHALAEMKAVTSLATVLIAEISPRLALIPKGAVATLAAELEKAGYTPQQTETTD